MVQVLWADDHPHGQEERARGDRAAHDRRRQEAQQGAEPQPGTPAQRQGRQDRHHHGSALGQTQVRGLRRAQRMRGGDLPSRLLQRNSKLESVAASFKDTFSFVLSAETARHFPHFQPITDVDTARMYVMHTFTWPQISHFHY